MHNHPLRNRIVIAFVLMTFVVSSVFSFALIKVFHYVEEQIISRELQDKLSYFLYEDNGNQDTKMQMLGVNIYSSNSETYPIPKEFSHLKFGFTEIVKDSHALHAYRRLLSGNDYLVIQDQTNLEENERALFYGVKVGYVLSIITAALVGWLLAKRLTNPLVRLTSQVGQFNPENPSQVSLAHEYGNDEIGHLARAFDKAFGQLNIALKRERLFTSDVSHELRTSLMVVGAASTILLQSNKENNKNYHYIERIKKANNDMTKLVQTFLILARSNKEESEVSEKVTLLTAAEKQIQIWQEEFKSKGLQLILEKKVPTPLLFNATFLDTVMTNLLRNALHYTNSGVVKIILEKNQFSIQDTGTGISIQEQALIFEPFYRGVNTETEGLGLGLSLVQRICNHQGWTVDVKSVSPQGSIFTVVLNPISL
ncbi:sensor histidine kinase [Methylotenera versatilis]|uniref:sensor histidine kinase n=1 Tax=Methylotenera versatilis TaxID=1055487 RepID=UPI0006481465|nr:HAMP domain-containing sensor histidine kinase [Methylotenera versatilis]